MLVDGLQLTVDGWLTDKLPLGGILFLAR